MRRIPALAILLALHGLSLPSSAAAGAVSIFLSPRGTDTNQGTRIAPVRSLERAQQLARAARARGDTPTVVLRAGLYTLTRALRLDERDSNTTWRAAHGEQAVVSGGTSIVGWKLWRAGIWTAPARGLHTRQLFVDGTRAVRARSTIEQASARYEWQGFWTPDPSFAAIVAQDQVEVVYEVRWKQLRGSVRAIVPDGGGSSFKLDQPFFDNARLQPSYEVTIPVWVENALELLDEPGEFFLDEKAGRIYYMPRPGQDMSRARVVAPRLEQLVTGGGSPGGPLRNLRLDGIDFSYTTWLQPGTPDGFADVQDNVFLTGENRLGFDATRDHWSTMPGAVALTFTDGLLVTGCRFLHLGGAGLELGVGTQNTHVVGNELTDISGSGIQLGDITNPLLYGAELVEGNELSSNLIHDVAVEYQGGVGIWAGFVRDTAISHNELFDLPYSAISVGWGWGRYPSTVARSNVITANLVHEHMRHLKDGGGVYLLGTQPDTVVSRNVVYGQYFPYGAYYLDEGSFRVSVLENVAWRSVPWTYLFKGEEHTIRGNYWDDTKRHWTDGCCYVSDNALIFDPGHAPAAIMAAAGLEQPWRARYKR